MMTEEKLEETIEWAKRMCYNNNLNRSDREIMYRCWCMMTSLNKPFDEFLVAREVGYFYTRRMMAMTLPVSI